MRTPSGRVVARLRSHYGQTVYTHSDWGSKHTGTYTYRKKFKPVRVQKADTLVQHITVTRPSGDFKADCRAVEAIGYDRFKSGVSYNWLVDMTTGEIAVGQPLDAKGTHTVNNKGVKGFSHDQNAVARAIAVVGMENTPLSAKAEEAIAAIQAAMMDEGQLTTTYDYVPHSFFAYKDCPCEATRSKMPAMRARAFVLAAGLPPVPKPQPKPTPKPEPKPEPSKPKSRGKNVDDALSSIEAAIKYAEAEKAKGVKGLAERINRLSQARCWLSQIDAK